MAAAFHSHIWHVTGRLGTCTLLWWAAAATAQETTPDKELTHRAEGLLQPVVITSGTAERARWDTPATLDVVEDDEIRAHPLQVNLSESLGRVPGLMALNRQNYAQDLQISVRGYGARSTFGVRGVRLFVDGIPATAPDGQGQAASFPLGSAERIEVLRGPFAALYGSSSGGVISLYTRDGAQPAVRAGVAGGADGVRRASGQAEGRVGALGYLVDVAHFTTDGVRPQAAARRDSAYFKLSHSDEDGRLVAVFSRQTGNAQDPLGLSRAEFNSDPFQTTAAATTFNTRKSSEQNQLGLAWEHSLGGGHRLEWMAYGGERQVRQFQAIPPAAQTAPTSAGGVIDLQRDYGGTNARWRFERSLAEGRLSASAGVAYDRQKEWRRGFENFLGTASAPAALGVQGALRRDEDNTASTLDPYAQLAWESTRWTLSAGVRHSTVRFDSRDHYITARNPDDSGASRYSGSMPVLGLRYRLSDALQLYASAGRGFETPTLNEVAYKASGASGLNSQLSASKSRNSEIGLRGRHGSLGWTATAFDIRTDDEIAVLTNTGGRSTYQNVGRSLRRGVELAGEAQWARLHASVAWTLMKAIYRDGFFTCTASPCSTPNVPVAGGSRIPGVAREQLFVQLDWEPRPVPAVFTLELRHMGSIFVNDTNTDAAPAYTVASLGAQFKRQQGPWELRALARVDNLTNRVYAGSVIVNEGNQRYFETAPGRSAFVGVELQRRFD